MPVFPLPAWPALDWRTAPRAFGSAREGGRRKHAGCDLYAPVGTQVRAIEDGVVLGCYPFYAGTWEVQVKCANGRILRYGEVDPDSIAVVKGSAVTSGLTIAKVGALSGLTVSMLHFEAYSGTARGALTDVNRPPFYRRADLIDPTAYLEQLKEIP